MREVSEASYALFGGREAADGCTKWRAGVCEGEGGARSWGARHRRVWRTVWAKLDKTLANTSAVVFAKVLSSFEQTGNFPAPPKAGGGPQRSAAHKQARRMVARATGRSSPLACAPRAPSRHRRKDPPDASVARRGALLCPERPRGAAQLRRVTPQLRPAAAPAADPARVSPCMDQYWNSP